MSDRTKPRKQRTQIIHLLGNPSLTHSHIAKAVGVSAKTVQRAAKEIKPAVDEVEQKLAEYQTLLGKRLPIKDRVALYLKIARKAESNLFAAMRALERADELDGILTAKDRGREPQPEPDPRPLFNLPPGTAVQINVLPPGKAKMIHVTAEPERNGKE